MKSHNGEISAVKWINNLPRGGDNQLRHIAAIPIDHIMISTQLSIKGFTTGPNIGSDHLPVIADIDIFE